MFLPVSLVYTEKKTGYAHVIIMFLVGLLCNGMYKVLYFQLRFTQPIS